MNDRRARPTTKTITITTTTTNMQDFPSGQRGDLKDVMRKASWVRIHILHHAHLTPLVEYRSYEPKVAGSRPAEHIGGDKEVFLKHGFPSGQRGDT